MFIFNESDLRTGRTVNRGKVLGYPQLIIADDVSTCDECDYNMTDGAIRVTKSDRVAGDDPEMDLLLPKFGVFNDIKSVLEITLCGDMLFVSLKEGAIDIELDGNLMMASRGVDVASIKSHSAEEVLWVDAEHFKQLAKYWVGENTEYVSDYIYSVSVSGSNRGIRNLSISPYTVEGSGYLYDISNGGLALVEADRQRKARIRNVRDMFESCKKNAKASVVDEDDLDFNIYEYMDDAETEDADDFDYKF